VLNELGHPSAIITWGGRRELGAAEDLVGAPHCLHTLGGVGRAIAELSLDLPRGFAGDRWRRSDRLRHTSPFET